MNSSPPSVDRWIRWTTTSSVVLVAGLAAVVSHRHMQEPALRHGESELGAILVPLAVDGMIVASSMSILLASRYGRRGGVLPWTFATNVAVADPTLIARIIAAWPSFALIGAHEILMGQIRESRALQMPCRFRHFGQRSEVCARVRGHAVVGLRAGGGDGWRFDQLPRGAMSRWPPAIMVMIDQSGVSCRLRTRAAPIAAATSALRASARREPRGLKAQASGVNRSSAMFARPSLREPYEMPPIQLR